jgi:dTDP-4-dehydrorhamnose 3,5-epimerase
MIREGKIQGVRLKPLRVFADDRGILAEVLRADDEFFGAEFERFGQTTLTMSYPGVIKAFHWHRHQDDAWLVVRGMIQAVLYDRRKESPTRGVTETYYLGDHHRHLLVIPRGIAHGYRVLGEEAAWIVYHASVPYNPQEPDEERIPFDDPGIGFDWTTRPR